MISSDIMTIPAAESELLEKTVGEMIGDDVFVSPDGSVTGTIKYINDFQNFSSHAEEQKGNYFPITLTKQGEEMTLKKNGSVVKEIPYDKDIIFRVENKDTVVSADVDGKEVVTLNFKNATLKKSNEIYMTKTKINMMNKENLVKLATQNGIENAETLNGNTLKKELISYYNL